MDPQQLLMNFLQDFPRDEETANGQSKIHVCTFPLFKGMPIRVGNETQSMIWKSKAMQVEQRCEERRTQNLKMLREKVKGVESALEGKRKMSKEHSSTDFNHNSVCSSSDNKSIRQRLSSLDGQVSDDCKIVSDGSILRSCLRLSDQEDSTSSRDFDVDHDRTWTFNTFSSYVRSGTSSNFCSHARPGTSNNISVHGSPAGPNLSPLHDAEREPEARHTNASTTSEFVPEVQQHIEELHHLQEQQKQLDHWYVDMQKELELEKVRLAERYDEMRLKNIKEQQKIIENSQEYLKNSFIANSNVDLKNGFANSNGDLRKTINSEVVETSFGRNSSPSHEREQNDPKTELLQNLDNHTTSATSLQQTLNNISTSTVPKSPPWTAEVGRNQTETDSSCPAAALPPTADDSSTSNTVKFSVPTNVQFTAVHSLPIKSPIINNREFPLQTSTAITADSFKPQTSPRTSPIQRPTTTPLSSHSTRQQISPVNTPTTDRLDDFISKNMPNVYTKKSTGGDLLSQHYHMVDNKFRRKSRAMKFFKNPVPTEKNNASQQFMTPENSSSNGYLTAAETAGTSTSTPHEAENILPVPYDLSPVFADEIPFLLDTQENKNDNINASQSPSRVKNCRTDLIVALFKGFIVRRLLKTYKVKEIVKTIKDTNLFLQDIENEAITGKKSSMSIPDRQLRIRLNDELSTKHQKLHDIFFEMSTTEQLRLISISRKQEEEKKMKRVKKVEGSKTHQHVGKKLSTASQKSMQRRRQQPKATPSTKTAPLKNSTPTKVKKTTNNEARALKPIQSNSPTFKRRPMLTTASNSSAKKITNSSPFKTNRTAKNRYSSAQ